MTRIKNVCNQNMAVRCITLLVRYWQGRAHDLTLAQIRDKTKVIFPTGMLIAENMMPLTI